MRPAIALSHSLPTPVPLPVSDDAAVLRASCVRDDDMLSSVLTASSAVSGKSDSSIRVDTAAVVKW